MKYVAFLRGINIGKKQVKIEELKRVLNSMGFENVKTLLASGNLVFETSNNNPNDLTRNLEEELRQAFEFEIPVILYSFKYLQDTVQRNPFQKIPINKNTRLYITFSSQPLETSLPIPYNSPDKNFKILDISSSVMYSVVQLTKSTGTLDLMNFLEKKFGKNITTRNWNTVEKIFKL